MAALVVVNFMSLDGGVQSVLSPEDLRRLCADLADRQLIDAYRVIIFSVVLGAGKRMFGAGSRPVRLTLTSSRTTGTGVSTNTYVTTPGPVGGPLVRP